jgi:alanine dehydrogenase
MAQIQTVGVPREIKTAEGRVSLTPRWREGI